MIPNRLIFYAFQKNFLRERLTPDTPDLREVRPATRLESRRENPVPADIDADVIHFFDQPSKKIQIPANEAIAVDVSGADCVWSVTQPRARLTNLPLGGVYTVPFLVESGDPILAHRNSIGLESKHGLVVRDLTSGGFVVEPTERAEEQIVASAGPAGAFSPRNVGVDVEFSRNFRDRRRVVRRIEPANEQKIR